MLGYFTPSVDRETPYSSCVQHYYSSLNNKMVYSRCKSTIVIILSKTFINVPVNGKRRNIWITAVGRDPKEVLPNFFLKARVMFVWTTLTIQIRCISIFLTFATNVTPFSLVNTIIRHSDVKIRNISLVFR